MSEPAPDQSQAQSRRAACVHCGYDLHKTSADGKCPECGNAASDTREGTLFYRLSPTRLGTILVGAVMVCVMHAFCLLFAVLEATRWLVPGGLPSAAVPVLEGLQEATHLLYVPWVALFVLAAPLNQHATWISLMRLAAIVLTVLFVVIQTALNHYLQSSPPVGPGPSGAQVAAYVMTSTFVYVPALLASVRLLKIARRLPAAPFTYLGSVAVVCAILVLARTGLDSSGVFYSYAIPQSGIALMTVLMWAALTVFPFLVYRELHAVARDVDADHPYTRVWPFALRLADAQARHRPTPEPHPRSARLPEEGDFIQGLHAAAAGRRCAGDGG